MSTDRPRTCQRVIIRQGGPHGYRRCERERSWIRAGHRGRPARASCGRAEAVGGTTRDRPPTTLLLTALGACTSMTLAMYARRKQWPLERVSVRLQHGKIHGADCAECETREGMLDRIERDISLVGPLSGEQRDRLRDGESLSRAPHAHLRDRYPDTPGLSDRYPPFHCSAENALCPGYARRCPPGSTPMPHSARHSECVVSTCFRSATAWGGPFRREDEIVLAPHKSWNKSIWISLFPGRSRPT